MKFLKNVTQSFSSPIGYAIAIVLGVVSALCNQEPIFQVADVVSSIFMNLLKLVSLPILFLSTLSVASGAEHLREIKHIGKKVLKYTLLTTVIAATVALALFLIIDPSGKANTLAMKGVEAFEESPQKLTYLKYLVDTVPSNIVQPFVSNNVLGVMFLAFIFGLGLLAIPQHERTELNKVITSLYTVFMKVTSYIVSLIPIALWAFITLFVRDVQGGLELSSIGLYLLCVVLANVIQATVVLPILLKSNKISPIALVKAMSPALTLAFFTKSSSSTIPTAVKVAVNKADMDPKTANFVFPLCTTINMNGCAAFILITVLFVAQIEGVHFTLFDMCLWVFIATVAAVGNAGVPMGCYFLAGAFLASMNVPLNIMGVILPFYSLIDALETAINVWSDSCVAKVVDSQIKSVQHSQA